MVHWIIPPPSTFLNLIIHFCISLYILFLIIHFVSHHTFLVLIMYVSVLIIHIFFSSYIFISRHTFCFSSYILFLIIYFCFSSHMFRFFPQGDTRHVATPTLTAASLWRHQRSNRFPMGVVPALTRKDGLRREVRMNRYYTFFFHYIFCFPHGRGAGPDAESRPASRGKDDR